METYFTSTALPEDPEEPMEPEGADERLSSFAVVGFLVVAGAEEKSPL